MILILTLIDMILIIMLMIILRILIVIHNDSLQTAPSISCPLRPPGGVGKAPRGPTIHFSERENAGIVSGQGIISNLFVIMGNHVEQVEQIYNYNISLYPCFRSSFLSLEQPHPVFSSAHQHHFEPFSKVPTQSSTNFTWQLPHHHVET